jgi:alkyl hydroperoxide reductase subunit F
MTIEQILEKLGASIDSSDLDAKDPYDVLIIGGGPAGSAAAIYAARKGIRTGLLTETLGGLVVETLGIENIIGTKYTEGPKFMADVESQIKEYPVDIITSQRALKLDKKELIEVSLMNGATLKSKTVVVATGARWRNIGVPGEVEFKNKGIAYCPHCDGPLFTGKNVAVIGGGNSGIEAAIDLAGIVNHVTVIEFSPTLKADEILQKRLHSLNNVTLVTNAQTKEISGTGKVESLTYTDRNSGTESTINIQGVFILIGLIPNTEWLTGTLKCTKSGEIIVDKHGATSLAGVFAAGDCTDSAYKQIIISMGSGATAALGAFDFLIRN